jgi:hypothetical protein
VAASVRPELSLFRHHRTCLTSPTARRGATISVESSKITAGRGDAIHAHTALATYASRPCNHRRERQPTLSQRRSANPPASGLSISTYVAGR